MSFLIPLEKEFEGAAKNILKGAGLAYLKPKFFNIDLETVQRENETYQLITQVGYDKIGMLGLPVWDTVTLIAEPYTTDDGLLITTPTGLTLDIALIEISNDRNIVKTKIAGANGSIKEYMSDGDFNINIKGSLVSKYSNMPPIEELNTLNIIIKHPEELTVRSNFIDYFDIQKLVIEKPIIKQREGMRNVVDFELQCVSDYKYVLGKYV
jgi:hypothetical protein